MWESDGKILVVALVLAVIFLGIAAFLFYLDRRLSSAEKSLKEQEGQHKKDIQT